MSNLQKRPQQEPEVSIYDPECPVYSPHIIAEWLNNINFAIGVAFLVLPTAINILYGLFNAT
jgi:hypothetical protein